VFDVTNEKVSKKKIEDCVSMLVRMKDEIDETIEELNGVCNS
jgi:hypothetical protein